MTDVHLWARALSHEIRVEALRELRNGDQLSPNVLAKRLDRPLGVVSYHLRRLHALTVVKLVRKAQRRGAVEHFYVITPLGQDAIRWADLAPRNSLTSQPNRK